MCTIDVRNTRRHRIASDSCCISIASMISKEKEFLEVKRKTAKDEGDKEEGYRL